MKDKLLRTNKITTVHKNKTSGQEHQYKSLKIAQIHSYRCITHMVMQRINFPD